MNIFRAVNTVLYPLFIFLLFSGRNLLESTDTSAGSTPGSGADTNESQPASATPPSGGTTLNPDQDATSTTPPASTNEGQQARATPTSGGTTPGTDAGSGTKTGVELSLKATASTDQFDHNKNNKIVTYTAKDTYGFKSVKTGDTVVWSTSNANEYASKVVLDGKGQKKKTVTIHMLNGTTKSYRREAKDKPWNEYTGPLPSTDNAKASNKSDGSGFELNIKPDGFKSDDDNFDVQKSHGSDVYLITFKSGVKCSSVKVEDKEVWQYCSPESKHGYPKKVTYCKNDNRVTINFEGKDIVYNKSGDKWEVKVALKVSTTNSSGTGGATGTDGSGTPASRGGTGTPGSGTPESRDGTSTGGGGTHTGRGSTHTGGGNGGGTSPPSNESSGTHTGGSGRGGGTDQTSGGRR